MQVLRVYTRSSAHTDRGQLGKSSGVVKNGEIPGFGTVPSGVLELETTKYGVPVRTIKYGVWRRVALAEGLLEHLRFSKALRRVALTLSS